MDPFGIDYITSHKRGVPYAYKVLFKRIAAVAGSLDTILSVPTASEDDVSLYKALHRKWLAVFVEEEPSFGRERVYNVCANVTMLQLLMKRVTFTCGQCVSHTVRCGKKCGTTIPFG